MVAKARQWVVPHVIEFDPQLREALLTIEDYLAQLDLTIQNIPPPSGGGGGVTDHGALTGLTPDDDHPQYHTDARGDARYVNTTGDTMTAPLTVPNGTAPGHAVNKSQLDGSMDDRVAVAGDVMTGPLGMSNNQIFNLADGTNGDHAVNKSQLDAINLNLATLELDDLLDVNTSDQVPAGGEALVFVPGAPGLWAPRVVPRTTMLDALDDVDTTSDAPENGQVLTWDETAQVWRPADVTPTGTELGPEVISTDASGIGTLFYGPNLPPAPGNGAVWMATRWVADDAPVSGTAPTGTPEVTITPPTTTDVTVSWTSVVGATSYDLFLSNVDAVNPFVSVVGTTTVLTLVENTLFDIKVQARNGAGVGPLSAVKSVVVPNQVPPPVNNLAESGESRGVLNFAWDYDAQPGDHSTYVVTATAGTVTVDQPNRTAAITGLGDTVTVTCTVKAQDSGGLQSTAVTANGTTPAAPLPGAPPTPANFKATRIGYSSADFTWSASAGATSYEVSGDGTNYSTRGTALSYSWTGRAESTTYKLYLRARNAGGASAATTVTFKTLPKVNHYNPTYATHTYGYGNEAWSGVGVGFSAAGVGLSTDNWCGGDWLYAVDLNTNTGPYSTTQSRWITFSFTANFDHIYQIYGLWGYPGTFGFNATDTSNVVTHSGSVASNSWPLWLAPNIKSAPTGKRISKIQMSFSPGLGSPGVYKLREWAIQVRLITGQTPVYNPA